jgi:hypothetical protein
MRVGSLVSSDKGAESPHSLHLAGEAAGTVGTGLYPTTLSDLSSELSLPLAHTKLAEYKVER